MEHSLNGVRVVDLSGDVAAAFCAKLLFEGGAEVIRPEQGPPELFADWPPECKDGAPGGVLFRYLRAGITVAPRVSQEEDGAQSVRRLVESADIILRSGPASDEGANAPGTGSIVVNFSGPVGGAQAAANDLLAYAASGAASVNGRRGLAPLKGSGYQASFLAGAAGCVACLALLHRRHKTGQGGTVNVPLVDSLLCTFAPSILSAQYRGRPPEQRVGGFPVGPIRARDGAIVITVSRAHFWRDAMNVLGLEHLAESEPFYDPLYRQEHYAEVSPLVEAKVSAWHRDELFQTLSDLRVTCGKVMAMDEMWTDPHLAARGFLSKEPISIGPPFKLNRSPLRSVPIGTQGPDKGG